MGNAATPMAAVGTTAWHYTDAAGLDQDDLNEDFGRRVLLA